MFSGEPASALVERWQWTFPIIFSYVDPNVLYTSSQHVWKTTNGGQTWDKISGDLTRHDPKTLGDSGGPITHDMNAPEVYATVFSIGPGKTDVNIIWAGSDDGLVNVTRDGGKSWTNVTPKEMPDLGRVSQIDASAFDPGGVYVAVKKPLLGDKAPYIFRSHDFGRTWTKIVTGIKPDDYVHTVREDRVRKGLLYAGTQHGAYVSFNDGDSWESLSLNLPDTPIADLVVDGSSLAIATHGRGFYVLDDVEPLRQWGAPVTTATDAYLFKPGDAIRGAGGATITYWVKGPVQNMTLDILDGRGQVIRTFAGAMPNAGRGGRGGRGDQPPEGGGRASAEAAPDRPAPPAPGDVRSGGALAPPTAGQRGEAPAEGQRGAPPEDEEGGGRGRGGNPTASMAAGVNRVVWDLNYAPATTFPGMVLWGASTNGPAALPGTYQVRLTVNGRAQTQPIVIRKHPLRTISDADLKEQFDLAVQIRDKVTEANNAVIQIRKIKTAVTDRLSKSNDAEFKVIANRLMTNLSVVEEAVYQVKNQSNQDPLNFPIKINNRLASLLRVVNQGDGKPIGNAPVIFKDLAAELKAETDKLQQVLQRDLPAFNTVARQKGLEPIPEK
jgi:hypothetical protein